MVHVRAVAYIHELAVMRIMTTEEAYYNLTNLFKNLESHLNLSDLNTYIDETGINEEINSFYNIYPKFSLNIEVDEILELKRRGILDDQNKINPITFTGTALERLLVAALWKNRDINKLQHIVDGILQTDGFRTDYSLIFKQFGHSLTDSSEPIVDQHVLRAYEIKSLTTYSEQAVNSLRKKSVYKTSDKAILKSYREWFKNIIGRISVKDQSEYKEKLDKILFVKGKAVKT